jgi:ABC-2 type transport system ATP-binding protein
MSISVQGVTKLYGEQKALNSVSFEVKTGEIVAFLGPNGAGKSTMMKIITGFIPASSGIVLVNGMDVSGEDPAIRKSIGYLPENNPLYPEMFVKEYLGFVAALYKTSGSIKKQVDSVIELTGLRPEYKKKIGALSKGYRQRVGLAQALIHDPSVLILDEATSGLDPNQIVEIRNLIREAGKEKTVLLSTHIMQEVDAICDRIIIIDKGVIVANELKENIHSGITGSRQIIMAEFDNGVEENELRKIPGVHKVTRAENNRWIIEAEGVGDIRPAIFSFAVNHKLIVLSLQKEVNRLEDVFRELTGG